MHPMASPHKQPPEAVPHEEQAWEWFRAMGSPKYWVAPMVDQSELAFRQLSRRHGATGACTPMLHARLFLQTPSYRAEHFTTTQQVVASVLPWLTEFTDLRDQLNHSHDWDTEQLRAVVFELLGRIEACGRTQPQPALSARALARMQAEAGLQAAIEEQKREEMALQQIDSGGKHVAPGGAASHEAREAVQAVAG
ncbi:hypothetical protein D9Q98_006737 [Chlorella vulgaris]|uniref:DUS-like FMN-binding domain-containing protein n=1 Tax=Chlorella vulgaris TaxID=3077 RepID=A0A9D4TKX8_CHLVU|nr:hypothetical protein D9Q98_006737 [Chlorella vulgaris]